MEKNSITAEYETPRIADHGDLAELTAAAHATGVFDANYHQGEVIPPGGAGTGTTP